MKKKILIALGVIVFIALLFIGIEYIQFLKATKRMEELEKDLEQRITEREKKEFKRPPLFGPAIEGNAAEYYQQAESQMTELWLMKDWEVWRQWSDYVESFKPLSPTALSYYEKAKPIIELVRKGNNVEVYKSLINIRDGFECEMPHLTSSRNIANAMVIQGRELENNNQYSDALQLYCKIIRFGDSYFHYGTLIPAMISIAASEIGYEEIRRVLLTNKLSDNNLTKLISDLRILFYPETSFNDVWDSEQLNEEAALLRYAKIVGFFDNTPIIGKPKSLSFMSWLKYYTWFNRTRYIETLEDIRVIYPDIKRINKLSYVQAKQETEKFDSRINALKNPVTQILIPGILGGKTSYLQHQAQRRGLYILCALEIYRVRHQKYPEKLSDLTPDIIKDIPLDPFSDQPFIYKVNPDGKTAVSPANRDTITLYSVSDNLKDDGGDEKHYNDIVIAPPLGRGSPSGDPLKK